MTKLNTAFTLVPFLRTFMVGGSCLCGHLASGQETVAPAQPVTDLAKPLVESGDTPSLVPPPMISKPEEAPLPTDDSSQNSETSSGTSVGNEVGTPAGQLVSPMLTGPGNDTPPIPPMMNTSKSVQLSLDVESVYDNNIFFSSKDPVSDYIFVVSPKLTLQRGDFRAKEETYGILNYNPQAIFFAQGKEDSTLDQNLKAEVQYAIARLAIGLEGSYQRLSGATPDLGNRVDRDQLGAKLRLSYGWGAKMEAETNFLYTGTNYDPAQLADFSEFVNETFLRYQVTARTKAALGAAIGRLDVDGFGHQDFERALVQVISEVGSKLTLKAKGGMEFRQTEMGHSNTPVFSIAMDYKLREGTTVALESFRDVAASGGLPGDNITRTGVVAKVRQKLGTKFVGGLDVGYEQLAYAAADRKNNNPTSTSRDDDYFYFRPSLQYELKEGRRLEIYYLHRQNDSSQADASFDGTQIGVRGGIDF